MIKPTRGRVVLFTPAKSDHLMSGDEPLAAIIAHVHSDTVLNLTVFDAFGRVHARPSVELVQEGEKKAPGTAFAEWMPYQKGPAAKTELLEQKLTAAAPSTSTSTQATLTDDQIEAEIVAAGKTAPRVTPGEINAAIASEFYFTALQGARMAAIDAVDDAGGAAPMAAATPLHPELALITFCVLILRNGFKVIGDSAPVSSQNFDAEMGRKIARQNALEKIWALEGYLLKERLYQLTQPMQSPE